MHMEEMFLMIPCQAIQLDLALVYINLLFQIQTHYYYC